MSFVNKMVIFHFHRAETLQIAVGFPYWKHHEPPMWDFRDILGNQRKLPVV